jgi:CBS domain-containing protein
MLVDTIMTTPVVAIHPSMTVREAARLMVAGRFGGLPVVSEDGTLVGMVSEGDLLRRGKTVSERKSPWWLEWFASAGKSAEDYAEIYERSVGDVMSRDLVVVNKGDRLDDVADLMVGRQIKRLPVVENGKLVGLVARIDLLRGLSGRLPGDDRHVSPDAKLQAEIEAAITGELGRSFVRTRVEDGVIKLRGIVFNEKAHVTAVEAARRVAGSRSVEDGLVWVEPMADRVVLP